MMAIAAKSWLPAEMSGVQPYSMGPLLRDTAASCVGRFATPAVGTCVGMDRTELMISSCFVAPMDVQRDAQKRGQRGIMMIMPKGLIELIGDDPKLWPRTRTKVPAAATWVDADTGVPLIEGRHAARTSFMDSLADLEDED